MLGAASYATPLLSTLFLILAGFAEAERRYRHVGSPDHAGGGLIAAKDMIGKQKHPPLERVVSG